MLAPDIEYFVVPPLCPLVGSPYDFSRTAESYRPRHSLHRRLLAQHGCQQGKIPPRDAVAQPLNLRAPAPYAALQKRSTEPANIFAVHCHIRDRRPYIVWACRIGWTKLPPARIIWLRVSMDTLLLSVLATLHHPDDLRRRNRLADRHRDFRP